MKINKTNTTMSNQDFEQLGRDMWNVYELNYKDRKRMYLFTFVKGVMYGFGIFLGGTIIVATLLYSLSFFEQIPLLSPFIQKINKVIKDPTSVQR